MRTDTPIFDIVGITTGEVVISDLVGPVVTVGLDDNNIKESVLRRIYMKLFSKRKIQ